MDTQRGNKVVAGVSGGIDSAFAAHYLVSKGFSVTGVTLRFFSGMGKSLERKDDRTAERAGLVCKNIGIEHVIMDAGRLFTEHVVDYLVNGYDSGETPNPCIMCNQYIKFPLLKEAAERVGSKWIATGHYARIRRLDGKPVIAAAADRSKDQSYFLYRVSGEQLEKTIFPLGEIVKDEIKAEVEKRKIPAAERESQDICFTGREGLEPFLEEKLGITAGDVLDVNGNKMGKHRGTSFYTVGQRKGLGISARNPLYVVEIDAGKNVIVLGESKHLAAGTAECRDIRITDGIMDLPLKAKIRYRHAAVPVEDVRVEGERMTVRFREVQRAVTPGQSLVLYHQDMVVGGGIITGAGRR